MLVHYQKLVWRNLRVNVRVCFERLDLDAQAH